MTRKEEIKEAAIEFSKRICSIRPELNVDSFTEGAKWADEHPNGTNIKWQKGEPKEEIFFFVTLKSGVVIPAIWSQKEGWHSENHLFNFNNVIAWCKLSDIEPYKEG